MATDKIQKDAQRKSIIYAASMGILSTLFFTFINSWVQGGDYIVNADEVLIRFPFALLYGVLISFIVNKITNKRHVPKDSD